MADIRTNYIRHAMATLWFNWLIGVGALAMELLLPRVLYWAHIPKIWLPLPIIVMAYALAFYERQSNDRRGPGSAIVLHVAGLTLFWSALVMVVINILNSKMLFDGWIDWSATNRDIPFITVLILLPTLTFVCIWVISRGYEQTSSDVYRAKNGIVPGNGAVASLLSIETRYQVKALLIVSVALNAVEWWYYFYYYINTNMNTPDVFFFNWMPIALYVISLVFLVGRYRSMATLIGPIAMTSGDSGAAVRFIIISGDRILLAPTSYGRWDTPASTSLPPLDAHSERAIKSALESISGSSDFSLRRLYDTSIGNDIDILHYAAFFPSQCSFANWPDAQWMTIEEIDQLIKSASVAAEFNDEIYRIFTITITWKTYDSEGRRIYPIKNYRPAFRLKEMQSWDVDYSDMRWLDIAKYNQDKPFYRIRRLWRRLTGGN